LPSVSSKMNEEKRREKKRNGEEKKIGRKTKYQENV
jgi:hypothetical protein